MLLCIHHQQIFFSFTPERHLFLKHTNLVNFFFLNLSSRPPTHRSRECIWFRVFRCWFFWVSSGYFLGLQVLELLGFNLGWWIWDLQIWMVTVMDVFGRFRFEVERLIHGATGGSLGQLWGLWFFFFRCCSCKTAAVGEGRLRADHGGFASSEVVRMVKGRRGTVLGCTTR